MWRSVLFISFYLFSAFAFSADINLGSNCNTFIDPSNHTAQCGTYWSYTYVPYSGYNGTIIGYKFIYNVGNVYNVTESAALLAVGKYRLPSPAGFSSNDTYVTSCPSTSYSDSDRRCQPIPVCTSGTGWNGSACVACASGSITLNNICVVDNTFDHKYNQLILTCPSPQISFLGKCQDIGANLTALFALATNHIWTQSAAGVWWAKPVSAAEAAAFDSLNSLAANSGLTQNLPALVGKDLTSFGANGVANVARVAAAESVLVTASALTLAGVAGWQLGTLGYELMDLRELSDTVGCATGWSGYSCNVAPIGSTATQWPSDNKPTYYLDPVTSTVKNAPLDPDRSTIDLTQKPDGIWEHTYTQQGQPIDIGFTPNLGGSVGPAMLKVQSLPNGKGTLTTLETPKGSAIVYNPPVTASTPKTAIISPLFDPTTNLPKPVTDAGYAPLPDGYTPGKTSPSPVDTSTKNPVIQSNPSPLVSPIGTTSNYSPPQVQTTDSPIPSKESPLTTSSSCSCPLTLAPLSAPSFSDTTQNFSTKFSQNFNLPSLQLSGSCPLINLNLGSTWGTFSTDVHCQIIETNRTIIQSVELILWLIAAFKIVTTA